MPLVYDHTPAGLVVAREGAGEAQLRRALKQFDARLMLDYAIDPAWGRQVWQVLCKTGPDSPPQVVCRWRDEKSGEPLPLSFGLLDRVKQLHMESRAPKVDHDAENDRHRDRLAADAEAEMLEATTDLVKRLRGWGQQGTFHRGTHLRRAAFGDVTDVR